MIKPYRQSSGTQPVETDMPDAKAATNEQQKMKPTTVEEETARIGATIRNQLLRMRPRANGVQMRTAQE